MYSMDIVSKSIKLTCIQLPDCSVGQPLRSVRLFRRGPSLPCRDLLPHAYTADSLGVPSITRMLNAPTDIIPPQHAGRTYFYQEVSWYSFLCRWPWINVRFFRHFSNLCWGPYTYLFVVICCATFVLFRFSLLTTWTFFREKSVVSELVLTFLVPRLLKRFGD